MNREKLKGMVSEIVLKYLNESNEPVKSDALNVPSNFDGAEDPIEEKDSCYLNPPDDFGSHSKLKNN